MASKFSKLPTRSSQPASRTVAASAGKRSPSAQDAASRRPATGPAFHFETIPIWPGEREAAAHPTPAANVAPPIVHEVLRHPGQPLDAPTRASLQPRWAFDFSRVRIHTDAQAAQSARAVDANAYTVGRNIVFGAGQFAPRSHSGRELLHHELMHVVQQRSALPGGALAIADIHSPLERQADLVAPSYILQRQPKPQPKEEPKLPTSLSQYPEVERKKIRLFQELVSNIEAPVNDIFGPDAAVYPTDPDTQIVFGDNIASKDRKQLESLANYLVGNAPKKLGLDETVTVPIAPLKQVVRFTYFEHGKSKKVILMEALGPKQAPGTKEGEAKFKAKKCTFSSGWDSTKKELVYQALALTPDSAVPEGLKFALEGEDTKKAKRTNAPSTEAGIYDPDKNTITVFDAAFKGAPENQIFELIHEIGHGADFGPVREAKAVYDASQKTTADEAKVKQARALSGGDLDAGDFSTEFRQAAKKDGLSPDTSKPPRQTRAQTEATLKGSPTDYGDTNWKELFSESFSIYVTDPGLLQAIRPNIYDYFVKKFPAAPAPAKKAAP
jgi:hypothetical protein